MIKRNRLRPSILVLTAALLSVGLAGCDEKKPAAQTSDAPALPLTTGPATASVAAPAASALPKAPPVKVVHVTNPADRYAYVDRAYEMSRAIGQAPPDYGFDYEGVHPWVWRSSNREVRLIEPVDGGYRYYYYRPGAENPYLVKDPDYSYGYSDGQLVAVYDNDGRMLPPGYFDRHVDDAGRYLARATALYRASVRSERRSVNAANWAARRAALDAARARWEDQQNQQDDWRAYHAQHDAEDRVYWQGERDQRDRAARSFNDWQNQGYNGAPPPPVRYDGHDDRNGQSQQGSSRGDGSRDGRDRGPSTQQPMGNDYQRDPARQTRDDAARQAKAVADAATQARQQQSQADAAQQARQQQDQLRADAARQAQAKAVADAATKARQQQMQADAMRAQQKAQADAAQQAQQRAGVARQVQAKAAADAQAKQRAQADTARAQQKAQADAAAQAKAAHTAAPPQAQTMPGTVPLTKEQADAIHAADKKARDDARHRHDGDTNPPPQQ